jgi:Activator of Hsp90 ATPase homolog 1-like protein
MAEENKVSQYDWSRFVKRVNIDSDIATLYRSWATRLGLENWFLRKAIFTRAQLMLKPDAELKAGDEYEWYWHGWPDEMVERGKVLEANGRDKFGFSFGKAGNVRISIGKEEGQWLVELAQEAIPLDDHSRYYYHLGCSTGWTFYLTNLKSVLEGGPDLRNRDVNLKNVITA